MTVIAKLFLEYLMAKLGASTFFFIYKVYQRNYFGAIQNVCCRVTILDIRETMIKKKKR